MLCWWFGIGDWKIELRRRGFFFSTNIEKWKGYFLGYRREVARKVYDMAV